MGGLGGERRKWTYREILNEGVCTLTELSCVCRGKGWGPSGAGTGCSGQRTRGTEGRKQDAACAEKPQERTLQRGS